MYAVKHLWLESTGAVRHYSLGPLTPDLVLPRRGLIDTFLSITYTITLI